MNAVSKTIYGVNILCGAINLYYAPITFAVSFAVGTTVGLGIGLKRRVSLVLIDQNKKLVEKTTEKTAGLQEYAQGKVQQLEDSPKWKKIDHLKEKLRPTADRIQWIATPFVKMYLYFSGIGDLISKGTSYLWGFEEQKEKTLASLDPTPGVIGTSLSLSATAATIGMISSNALSTVRFASGCTLGYSLGLYITKNLRWKVLQVEEPNNPK